jgi:hypothetical protein
MEMQSILPEDEGNIAFGRIRLKVEASKGATTEKGLVFMPGKREGENTALDGAWLRIQSARTISIPLSGI